MSLVVLSTTVNSIKKPLFLSEAFILVLEQDI